MKSRLLIFVLLLLLTAGAFLMWRGGARHAAPETVTPRRQQVIEAIYATGEVEPVFETGVSAQMTGRIVDILVREGDAVTRGAILARLDDAVEAAKIAEDKADYDFLEKELARVETLNKGGHASRQAVDEARAKFDKAAARMETDRQSLVRKQIAAPLDGTVLRRDVEPGQTVTPADILFWIGRMKPLRIDAEVDEEDIPQVSLGQEALIKADAYPGEVIAARVAEITPRGDPVNKVFRVRLELPEDTQLMIGMTVEVNIISRVIEDALTLPFASVLDGNVYILDARGKVAPHAVRTGVTDGEVVEILDGLAGDEAVLLNPARWLQK